MNSAGSDVLPPGQSNSPATYIFIAVVELSTIATRTRSSLTEEASQ